MNWLADKLTVYIINKKIISSECYEVYQYGMLTGLEMTLCMAICTIIAIHLKSFLEFTVLIAVFFSLRAYFNKQRKRILFGIAALDIMFILLKLKVFWSLIMYTMLVVLLSMIFEISKKWMEVKR